MRGWLDHAASRMSEIGALLADDAAGVAEGPSPTAAAAAAQAHT